MLRIKDIWVCECGIWELCSVLYICHYNVENLIVNDPELKLDVDMSYMSHKEKYEEGVRRATIALKLFKKLQKDGFGGTDFVGYDSLLNRT